MIQLEQLKQLVKDKPNIGQNDRATLVQRTCDLLQTRLYDDLKFLFPISLEKSLPELIFAECQKIAKKRKTEPGPAEFVEAELAVNEKIATKIPETARINKSEEKPGTMEEVLLQEYLLDYSTLKEIRSIAGYDKLLMLYIACNEYARIKGIKADLWEIIVKHGLEISTDVLIKKEKTQVIPKKRNPLLTILAERYVDSFSNHIILTQVNRLNSKLELKLLTIVDTYYSLIKGDPRELPAKKFLENPEKYTDKKKLMKIVMEYEQKFDKEIGEIKKESDKIRKKHERGICSTKQKEVAQANFSELENYIKRAEQFHHNTLVSELTEIKNSLTGKLREYSEKVNTEKSRLLNNKSLLDNIKEYLRELSKIEQNPIQYTTHYKTYKEVIDNKTKEFTFNTFDELNDIYAEIQKRLKEISEQLSETRVKGRDLLKNKLEKECSAADSIEGKSLEEKTQLESLATAITEGKNLLKEISSCKTEEFEKTVHKAQNKIKAYDEKIRNVWNASNTLHNIHDQVISYTGELASAEFIKFHKEITATKNERASYLSRIYVDSIILPVVNTCNHYILKINNKLDEMKESLEAKIKRALAEIKTTTEKHVETIDELNEIKECEKKVQLIDDIVTYFSMQHLLTKEDKEARARINQRKQEYNELKKYREKKIQEYVCRHDALTKEVKPLFEDKFSAENIEEFKKNLKSGREEISKFNLYKKDRNLKALLDKTETTLTNLENTFNETLAQFISNLHREYKSSSGRLSKNSRNTTQAKNELITLNSRLDSLEIKTSTLLTTQLMEDVILKTQTAERKQEIASAIKAYDIYLRNKIDELDSAESLVALTTRNIKELAEATVAYDNWMANHQKFENELQTNRSDMMNSTSTVVQQKQKYDQVSADEGLAAHKIAKTLQTYATSLETIINRQIQNVNHQITQLKNTIDNDISPETSQGIEKIIQIKNYANTVSTHVKEQEKLSKSGYNINSSSTTRHISSLITTCTQMITNYEAMLHSRKKELDKLCSSYNTINTSIDNTKSLKQKINEFEATITEYSKFERKYTEKTSWKEDNALKTDFEKAEKTRTQKHDDLKKAYDQLLSEAEAEAQMYLQLKINIQKSWLKVIFLSPKLAYYTLQHRAAIEQKGRLNPEFSDKFSFKEYISSFKTKK